MAKAELINLEKELKKQVAFNKLANNSNNMLFNDYFFQINGKIRLVSVIISKFYGQKKVYISTINKAVSENDTAHIKDVYFTDPKTLTSQIKLNLGISVNESRQSKTLSKNALTLPGKMQGAASENYAIQQLKHISNIPQNGEKSNIKLDYNDKENRKYVFSFANFPIKKSILNSMDFKSTSFLACPVGACNAEAFSTTNINVYPINKEVKKTTNKSIIRSGGNSMIVVKLDSENRQKLILQAQNLLKKQL